MYQTLRFTTWTIFFLFNLYSLSPIYIVQPSGSRTGAQLSYNGSALANRTFRLPGIEEMDGEFHHHDSQGNDFIRIVKKKAVIRLDINPKPLLIFSFKPLSDSSNSDYLIVLTRRSEIDIDFKKRVDDVYLSKITGLSPPSILS